MEMLYSRLTRSLLRSTTLSTASGKEGFLNKLKLLTLFAKQRGSTIRWLAEKVGVSQRDIYKFTEAL